MMLLKPSNLFWFVFLYSWLPLSAQQPCSISFSGKVSNESGEPLPGATVQIGDGFLFAVTDAEGLFRFSNLCPGIYKVQVQYVGYNKHQTEIVINGNIEQQISLQPDVAQLEEVVIRAHQAHTEHVHNSAILNTKQLIETAGKSLGESLKEIPGVNTIQAGPGIFKPVIHGVHSQRILILNYGIRQEGQQWGAEHAPEIDPFIASNIVVIKDASAIKYGTDALGGVIVVNPPELPEKPGLGGKITSVAQSNGRSGTLSGFVEGGIKNHNGWGWRVQGTHKQSGDYHTPDYSLTNTGVKELNFSAAAGLHKPNYGFEFFGSQFQTRLGILKGTSVSNVQDLITAMSSDLPPYTSSFNYDIGVPRQEVVHRLVKVNAHMKKPFGEWRLQYGFQQNKRREFDLRWKSLQSVPSLNLVLETHTLEAEWEREKLDTRTLCIGITGMAQSNANVPGTQRIPFIPNFVNYSGGVFGVVRQVIGNWKWDAGVRYDYRYYQVKGYDYKNTYFQDALLFTNVSATIGANVRINSKQVFHWNASSAWRPPHVAELYSLGVHQSAAAIEYGLLLNENTNEVMDIHSTSFKNEQAFKGIGTYQYTDAKLSIELSGYANYIGHYIYLQPKGITKNIRGAYPYFRYAQTDVVFTGLDESVSVGLSPTIKLKQNVSLIRAINLGNTGNLPFIPPNRFDWAVRWDQPKKSKWKDVFLEAKARFTPRKKHAPRVISPQQILDAKEQGIDLFVTDPTNFDFAPPPSGYWLMSMSGGFSFILNRTKVDLRLSSENLFNQSYREYTNRFRYYADDLGRNFIFSIQVNF